MTTYAHTLVLDDNERIALENILERIVEAQDWESTPERDILDKLQNAPMVMASNSYFGE